MAFPRDGGIQNFRDWENAPYHATINKSDNKRDRYKRNIFSEYTAEKRKKRSPNINPLAPPHDMTPARLPMLLTRLRPIERRMLRMQYYCKIEQKPYQYKKRKGV